MPEVNELINTLRELFHSKCNSDKKLQSIAQKLAEGTYSDAHDYSVRVGELLSEAFSEVLTEEIYPELTQEIARQIIPSLLGSDHRMISDACVTVQEHLNQNAGIGLKPIEPEFDVSRAYDLADKYVSYDDHEKAKWVLGEPVENYSQSVVDDSIRRNADFQWRAGMSPKIVRKAESGSCKWCRGLAGTYDYADVQDTGNDVYRRHENCRCVVLYDPGDGKKQDVWSKKWRNENNVDNRINEISGKFDGWKQKHEERKQKIIMHEEEQSRKRPGPNQSTIISSIIDTKDYEERIKKLGENEKVTHKILYEGRNALYHRNGTTMEDMIYINSINGKHLVQKKYNKNRMVEPTERMKQMVMDNQPRTIIGIHNHPSNMMPSYSDLLSAKKYKYGVILCHNGNVIKYSVSDDANIDFADMILNAVQKDFDAGRSIENHLELLRGAGIDLEVIQ